MGSHKMPAFSTLRSEDNRRWELMDPARQEVAVEVLYKYTTVIKQPNKKADGRFYILHSHQMSTITHKGDNRVYYPTML